MKKVFVLGICALAWHSSTAQFSTGSGCEYTSNPQVGIGLSSCPNYHFVVNPSSSTEGAQVLFGGSSFISNTASFTSDVTALELQAPGDAILNLASHYNGSDYDNIWLGTDNTKHYIHCFGGGGASAKPLVILMREASTDIEAMKVEIDATNFKTSPNGSLTAYKFMLDNPPPPASGDLMLMYKDGNVVIPAALTIGALTTMNLTIDQTKLAVNGLIACNELKVIPAGTVWPDYVFSKSYNRMSLGEVENYIETNKHLPQFASACEVEKNGFNVGETQTKLLEAVEELYLHVIDLKKENEALKKEISALKK